MAKKHEINTFNILFITLNIVLAVVIVVVIIALVNSYTRTYTEHGVEIEVPNIKGMTRAEAEMTLEAKGLKLVIIDSTYSDKVPFGTVIEQDPQPHISDSLPSHVKEGRAIYVTMNASTVRKVEIPKQGVLDVSYRQATSLLRSLGLVVDTVFDYQPAAFRDLVLDIKCNGKSLKPGQKVDVGTKVRLVVSYGLGTEEVEVPSVIGMTYDDAYSYLRGYRLDVGAVHYDQAQTVTQYVYRQRPKAGQMTMEGERIELFLSSDRSKALNSYDDEEDEDDFIKW